MPNIASGHAHGKIILMGEHAVVYGQPAIAMPLKNITLNVSISPCKQLYINCDFYQGLLQSMPELFRSLQVLIEQILKFLNQEKATFKINLNSQIPIERGMGSSAAVAVATTRALFDYFNTPLSNETLLNFVNISETIAHGKPSGIDALLTSHNQPYYFIKGKQPEPIINNLAATLIVADTGITGQTKLAVQNVKQLLEKQPETTQTTIQQLGQLATQSKRALTHNQPVLLGQYMNQAHNLLQNLNISIPELDNLTKTALNAGAYGAKLTGGGLGGCMIALCEPNKASTIQQQLLTAGAKQTWCVHF